MFSLKMKKLHTVLLSVIALGVFSTVVLAAADQPLLRSVEFSGNRAFSQRRLLEFSGLQLGQKFAPGTIDRAESSLLRRLAAEGYYFSQIDSVGETWQADSSQVDLVLFISEGQKLLLSELTIAGDTLRLSERFLPLSRPGRTFMQTDLEDDLWNYLRLREEEGHPFARLDIDRLQIADQLLSVKAKIIAGPTVTINAVRIAGLEHTRPRVAARETRISPDEIYRPSRVEKAQQRLRKLPFIEEVSELALVPLGSDRYDLLFTVKESRANSFDGVVGYQPGGQGQKAQVTGLLDLSFLNLFGTGRKARVHWERLSQSRQALELFYEEPWVGGWPFNLWGQFRQEIQDTLYLTRSLSGGASWPVLEILTLKGSVYQEEVLPDSAGRTYLGLYRSRSRGGALEVEYDTRDEPSNPTQGIYYRSYVSAAQKDYENSAPQDNLEVRRYESDADWSHRLWGRQILNVQVHGRLLQTDEVPIPLPDFYRLGGSRTLRGYREDQFLGSTVGWGSLEYRLWVDKYSRIYAFFNLGYYEYRPVAANSPQHDWPWGYGVGFRQGTRIGIIGFDFALGQGDALATAKVHFRLINRF